MIRLVIFFLMLSSSTFGQQILEATILDKETGEPVPFASIGIVGTSKGTSSNFDGQFSISISEPVLLQVTSIGYESKKIYSIDVTKVIELKPVITELDAVVVLSNPPNAKKILQKAFKKISENYNDKPFMQKFFYRHYCKDDDTFGRLIEASVDVWKDRGYKSFQNSAGEKESVRITQLRRSLDKTEMAQGHEPISVSNILETDVVGYQARKKSEHMSFYTNVSNLKTDMDSYSFSFKGITSYDGQEVYTIGYVYKKDSVLTTSGDYRIRAQATGSIFITTDTYAIIKTEELKTYGKNSVRTKTYYAMYTGEYYPYHFILEGESHASDSSSHVFHIELMSVEIKKGKENKFEGRLPGKEELLNIPYDSVFWSTNTTLKTTPLEDDIIGDLGGGISLNRQFLRYKQYEMNIRDGGVNGEEKFNWFKHDSKDTRILYLVFWSGDFQKYLIELELIKQLNQKYRNKITFVFLSLDDDEQRWKETVKLFSFYVDGIIHYRIGSHSATAKSFSVKDDPAFVLIDKEGEVYDLHAKRPSDPLLKEDFQFLLENAVEF